jgi:hypothetical protein
MFRISVRLSIEQSWFVIAAVLVFFALAVPGERGVRTAEDAATLRARPA